MKFRRDDETFDMTGKERLGALGHHGYIPGTIKKSRQIGEVARVRE